MPSYDPSEMRTKKSGALLTVGIVFTFILAILGIFAIGRMASQPVETKPALELRK